ncbi:spherulation-specific family 4 protein [Streptomyces sp. DH24]|uniref:spherulation-specific family 4 protein n=1 Tax=Streptomyces sp. DH24 TaxID=3040123 RepID=UPI0024426B6E|nr:spherulation-specific family 4 protein [Streptomyces sp. DH24]MDG9716155.1 spherulation-specific family 4 protein [Streptomyces sp. DH24]
MSHLPHHGAVPSESAESPREGSEPACPPGQLLVPYYEHPTVRPAEWDAIVAAAPRLYGVVLNPASGPGERPDPAFAEIAARLRAARVRVLGYADTGYGRRPHDDVVRDLARHRDWYGTDGAFLDQAAAGPGEFAYYRRLATAAWAAGCGTLALNHGTAPHPSYARLADLLVTFEGSWQSYRALRHPPWRGSGDVRLCHLVYGVPPGVDFAARARASGAAVHCAVPGDGDHPWGTLPHTLETAR